jgi:LysM repeat protein
LRLNQKLVILPVDGVSYEVQKGDTLSKIAKKFGLKDAKKITKYNKIFGSLKVGQNLIIPNGVLKTEKTRIRKRNKVSKISVRKKNSQASK